MAELEPEGEPIVESGERWLERNVVEPAERSFARKFPGTYRTAKNVGKFVAASKAVHALKPAVRGAFKTAHRVNRLALRAVKAGEKAVLSKRDTPFFNLMAHRREDYKPTFGRRASRVNSLAAAHAAQHAARRRASLHAHRAAEAAWQAASRAPPVEARGLADWARVLEYNAMQVDQGLGAPPAWRRRRGIRKKRQRGVGWRYVLPGLKRRLLHKKRYMHHPKK